MAIIYPSIATGDFASRTTDNNFSGSQTITGSLAVSAGSSDITLTSANMSLITTAASSPLIFKTNNNGSSITNGLFLGATNYVGGTNISPVLAFGGVGATYNTYQNWGSIYSAQSTGGSMVAGLNFHAGYSYGYGSFSFAGGDVFSTPGGGEKYIIIDSNGAGNGGKVTSYASSGTNAFRIWTDGARLKLGSGTDDYLYSDGTRIKTNGDFYASQTISGSTAQFTTISASAISASQYVGLNGYATLLSNNFSGSQTISGNLNVTGSQINLTSSELKSFSEDGIYFSLKSTGSTNDAGYQGAQINAYPYTDWCEIDLISRTTSSDGGIWLEVGPNPWPVHSASLWLQNNGVVELYGQNTDIISQTIRISGSNTTISGNLNVTGSLVNISSSDVLITSSNFFIAKGMPGSEIGLTLSESLNNQGSLIIYDWIDVGQRGVELDFYGGNIGGVYASAGPSIGPPGLHGSGLYQDYTNAWMYVYRSYDNNTFAEIQNVDDGGKIKIGTVARAGTSGSILIGADDEGLNSPKNIIIGNVITGSSTTISGNLNITGSNTIIRSNTTITGSIRNSGSLAIFGSGSATPLFDVQGSQGQLFSVTDSLSGSLFSVNDISGLPIVEVFSDNTILQGSFSAPSLNTTVKNVLSATGSFVVYAVPTASYDAAFFEYVARSGSNARAGQIITLWSGSSVNLTETTTTDFGSTSGLTFGSYISGSSMVLTGSATTSGWTIKTIVRSI